MGVFSIIIFLSQLVFAYLIATVTACLTNADAARARFSFKLTSAKLYMAREGVDQSLRHQVLQLSVAAHQGRRTPTAVS